MKKYEIAYHNYAEAKRASNAKIIYSNLTSDTVRSVKTTAYDQNNNIPRYFHILSIGNHMISVQFGINKHESIFSRTYKITLN